MADPKAEEKTEEKVKETISPKQDGELSETDFEKVSGGGTPSCCVISATPRLGH
ncbi:MAG TPA: hypothetical protein VKO18_00170 [Terriglobia bacterium]|nr:hypothetical protein [Terriglobia bacterium]